MEKELFDEKDSKLSSAIALDVIKIIEKELNAVGCSLKDYKITFNTTGFDISEIQLTVNDRNKIISIAKQAYPEVRHEFDRNPNKYAWSTINVQVSEAVIKNLGLDYRAYAKTPSDRILVQVSEPKHEKPLEPKDDIANMADDMFSLDQSDLGPGEDFDLPFKDERPESPTPNDIANALDEKLPTDKSGETGMRRGSEF